MNRFKCSWCHDTGQIKVPNDEAAYDKEFDRLLDIGSLSREICEERALKAAGGFTYVPCPKCSSKSI